MSNNYQLVSVVTPVHNTASYLPECIESVLSQTYQNFEYIIVENQSQDESGEIADHYARLDERIRVIRTDMLLPQAANYNFALRQISPTSRYTKVCQADDWLYPRCIEEMVALGELNPSIGLISSYSLSGTRVENIGLPVGSSLLNGRDACALFLRDYIYLFGTPTTVMYRSDIIRSRDPFYQEDRLHEDTEVCLEILERTDFGFVHQILSYCREHEQSITSSEMDMVPKPIDRVILVKNHGRRHLDDADYLVAEKDR